MIDFSESSDDFSNVKSINNFLIKLILPYISYKYWIIILDHFNSSFYRNYGIILEFGTQIIKLASPNKVYKTLYNYNFF